MDRRCAFTLVLVLLLRDGGPRAGRRERAGPDGERLHAGERTGRDAGHPHRLRLLGASRVAFNGRAASFKVTSPTRLTAVVPSGATERPHRRDHSRRHRHKLRRVHRDCAGRGGHLGGPGQGQRPVGRDHQGHRAAHADGGLGAGARRALRSPRLAPSASSPARTRRSVVPGWMDGRHGTASAALVITAADGPGTVTLPALNIHDCSYLQLVGLTAPERRHGRSRAAATPSTSRPATTCSSTTARSGASATASCTPRRRRR